MTNEVVYETASKRKKCTLCGTGILHEHIVHIDKGIVHYLQSLGETR